MKPVRLLRILSWLEGSSLLVLLLIAVPLKHLAGMPRAVQIVGSVHGLLFIMFGVTLLRISLERAWPWRRALRMLLLATLPGGVVAIERALRAEVA